MIFSRYVHDDDEHHIVALHGVPYSQNTLGETQRGVPANVHFWEYLHTVQAIENVCSILQLR